jgi:hypothetical protein
VICIVASTAERTFLAGDSSAFVESFVTDDSQGAPVLR